MQERGNIFTAIIWTGLNYAHIISYSLAIYLLVYKAGGVIIIPATK